MASAVVTLRTRAAALLSPSPATALAIRNASKKTGGSSKNLGGKSSGKRFGIKKMEGHYVHAGNILGTQRRFRWHPGAHGTPGGILEAGETPHQNEEMRRGGFGGGDCFSTPPPRGEGRGEFVPEGVTPSLGFNKVQGLSPRRSGGGNQYKKQHSQVSFSEPHAKVAGPAALEMATW
ncbi:39S ribosomal protein L27, mitochondrial isoform X3 [Nycticebus coucang]|uniref:39S ribosomal protein L27, mitochondrial isoform X3 n=1 Tax=Nycticebus coucang TaxID=9470 RepID=UPI00234CCACE|nr:39S ribosomal protein L27, mitochondrial isoform X3 [Nycticebus coucang]